MKEVTVITYDLWLKAYDNWCLFNSGMGIHSFSQFLGVSLYDIVKGTDLGETTISMPESAIPLINILASPHYYALFKIYKIQNEEIDLDN